MTNEERDLITQFVARVGGAAAGGFGSVPATQPSLPPIDADADRLIAQQFQSHPEARYRITQMAVVQEVALAQAMSRIQQLQAQLQQAQQSAQQPPAQSRGFLGSLFGGNAPPQPQQAAPVWNQGPGAQQAYAPPPQYPPNVQPGMFQRGGSGFLGSALTTAAGVAGGMVAGNALMGLFEGHGGGFGGGGFGGGGFGGGGFGGGMPMNETTIVNNYGDQGGGYADQGGGYADQGGGGFDNGGNYDTSQSGGDGGWGSDSGSDGGGSFDSQA